MNATKKLLALVLAVCMLIGMPLSINVSAADPEPLHVDNVYIGKKGTADEDYLFIQFSEPVILQTRTDAKLITLIVYDPNGNKTARMEIADTSEAGLGSSDGNGLLKVRLKSSWGDATYASMADWLEREYINKMATVGKIVLNIADNDAAPEGDSWIQTFKGVTTDTYLKNENASYTLPDIGNEALAIDISDQYKVTIEDAYFGTPSAADENYIYVKFSEKVYLQATTWPNALGVVVVDANNVVMERLIVDNFEGAKASDDNGLYRVKLKDTWGDNKYSNASDSVRNEFVSARMASGHRICFYVSDNANTGKVNGVIDLFNTKEDGTGKCLKNGTPEITACTGTGKEGFYYDFSDNYKLSLESVALKKDGNFDSFTLTFSDPVTLASNAEYGLCVMKGGQIIGSTPLVQGGWHGAKPGTTYQTTWNLKLYRESVYPFNTKQVVNFIHNEYTDAVKESGAQLCFYLQDTANSQSGDVISAVYTQDGLKKLKNGSDNISKTTKETYFIPVDLDFEDFIFTPKAYVSDKDKIFVEVGGQAGKAWTDHTYLAAFDGTGAILKEWQLTLCSNYQKDTTTMNVAFYFGADGDTNYNTIVDYCEATYTDGYELKLIVKEDVPLTIGKEQYDARGNGVVDTMIHYDVNNNVSDAVLRADIATDTADIGIIPWGETVTVKSVDVYEAGQVVITFSHDIDMDKLMAGIAKDKDGNDFFLGISAKGVNNLVGYDAKAGAVIAGGSCDQANIYDIKPYGDSKNTVIGRVDIADYSGMMVNLEKLKEDYPSDDFEYAIRLRVEMDNAYDSSTGVLPKNYNIDPINEGVSSPVLIHGSNRCCWTDVNFVEVEAGNVLVKGELKKLSDISTMTSGEAILMADSETTGFVVQEGVTLDLNGKTVTGSGIFAAGKIVDSSDGNAVIKTAKGGISVAVDNPQMPLYDGTGYRFFNYALQTFEHIPGENSATYGVHLDFTNNAAYTILSEQGSGSDLEFHMNVNTEQGIFGEDAGQDLRFNLRGSEDGADLIKKYGVSCVEKLNANGNVGYIVFMLKISGTNKIPAGDALVVKACAYSGAQNVDLTTFDNWTVLQ